MNINRVEELTRLGRMQRAGLKAFELRTDGNSGIYAYEQRQQANLTADEEQLFRANARAWEFFQSRPPSYRKTVLWWVVSAKQEATRKKRLATLIQDSEEGRAIGPLTRRPKAE